MMLMQIEILGLLMSGVLVAEAGCRYGVNDLSIQGILAVEKKICCSVCEAVTVSAKSQYL